MSEQDVQVVRDQFEAVNERDFERAMDLYTDDVVLVVSWGLEPGTYEGKEAVGRWFGDHFQMFDTDYRFELDELRSIGKTVFLWTRHSGRGRTSGVQVTGDNAYLYWVRDGRVARIQMYDTREEALAAAGEAE
jgi:ketosteroid isomerase-like protein